MDIDGYVMQFKQRWHEANAQGIEGHRVEYALQPLLAEVERLRAEQDDAVEGLRESENQHRVTREQWRADREALHGAIRQAMDYEMQSAHCDQYDVRNAVLSVLTADPQGEKCPNQEAKELLDGH